MRTAILIAALASSTALASPKGVTDDVTEHKGSDVKKPPAAAAKIAVRVEHAIDKNDTAAFLAILPGKIAIDGKSISKAALKAAIAKAGGLDAYLVIGKDDDWQVAAHNDGAWAVSRGEPTTTSAVIIVGVHGSWAVRGISTAAGVNDTLGVAVAHGSDDDDGDKPKSSVKLGAPQVKGKLGAAAVKKAVTAHLSEMRDCYDTAAKGDPKLNGTVTVVFTVADGKVTASSGTGVDDDLANCVSGVVDQISFGKGAARVKLPVAFSRK